MAVADDELRYILSMALTLAKAQSQALAELGAVLAKIAPENSEVLVHVRKYLLNLFLKSSA